MDSFNKYHCFYFVILLSGLFILSCKGEDDMGTDPPVEISEYNDEGFYIINEGASGSGPGSLSFYHREYEVVENNIFKINNNGEEAGNKIHSMSIINDKAYIVAGNSNKIVIANTSDMKKLGEINGFEQPRHILQISSDKAYVSQWGQDNESGSIQILDLNTNTITGSIETRSGPEEMVRVGNIVFLANTGGNFADSVITKINAINDEILKTIDVGLTPTYLELDKDLNLWALTRGLIVNPGNPDENIKGKLHKIENDEVVLSLNVKPSAHSLTMNITKDKLYFVQNGWVYEHPITNTSISLVPFIERDFLGFEVDQKTGDFIGLDGKNLEQNGDLVIYNSERMPLDTVEVGSSPIMAVFE